MISLTFSLFLTGCEGSEESPSISMDSVFLIPSGVKSNIQERMMANGNPTIKRIIRKVTVQPGTPNLGNIMSAASIIIKAVAAYMVITLITLRLLSSCQNWESLLGLAVIKNGR